MEHRALRRAALVRGRPKHPEEAPPAVRLLCRRQTVIYGAVLINGVAAAGCSAEATLPAELVGYVGDARGARIVVVYGSSSGREVEEQRIRETKGRVEVDLRLTGGNAPSDLRYGCRVIRLKRPLGDRRVFNADAGKRLTMSAQTYSESQALRRCRDEFKAGGGSPDR